MSVYWVLLFNKNYFNGLWVYTQVILSNLVLCSVSYAIKEIKPFIIACICSYVHCMRVVYHESLMAEVLQLAHELH